jgi:phosphatidylglycerol:prolipoprotein diacylglycerol transferase
MSYAYSWLFMFGAIVGLLWLGFVEPATKRPQTTIPPISRVDAGLSALIIGLLGARIGFASFHAHFFSVHPEEFFKFWNGGLSWAGGLVGALLGLGLYALISHQSFWVLADILALPGSFLAFAAWFGCLIDHCAYGKQAEFGFLTPPSPDIFGTKTPRWPVQSMGAILNLGILGILFHLRGKKLPQGSLACLSILFVSTGNFLLAFLRGDQVPAIHGYRADAIVSVVLMGVALLGFTFLVIKGRRS